MLLALWLLGAAGFLGGIPAAWWIGRRRIGRGAAALTAVAIGLFAGLALDVIIYQQVTADPSPNAPLGLMLLPFPLITNTIGALVPVLLVSVVRSPVE
jgi:hypothetical protein